MQEDIQTSNSAGNEDRGYNPIDDLNLSGLTKQQRMRVRQMLEEEKGAFSTSDDDIGCVEELELKLNMRPNTSPENLQLYPTAFVSRSKTTY